MSNEMKRPDDVIGMLFGDDAGNLTIHQAQAVAKEMVHNGTAPESIAFDIVGPKGGLRFAWLDPHLGLFQKEGSTGFLRMKEFEMCHDIHVENIQVKGASQ